MPWFPNVWPTEYENCCFRTYHWPSTRPLPALGSRGWRGTGPTLGELASRMQNPGPWGTGVPRPKQDKKPEWCRAAPGNCWLREWVCVWGRGAELAETLPMKPPKVANPNPPIPTPPLGTRWGTGMRETGRRVWGCRAGRGSSLLQLIRPWDSKSTQPEGAHLLATQPVDPEDVPRPETLRQGAKPGLRNCWVKDLIRIRPRMQWP